MANNCSWFYFRVHGFPFGMDLTFEARKLRILHWIYKSGLEIFWPVIKIGKSGRWHKVKEKVILEKNYNNELYSVFPIKIDFNNNETFLEIAFCFPYSHEEMMIDIENMNLYNEWIDPLFFHSEIVAKSVEGFEIPLITISSHDEKLECLETYSTLEGTSKCRKFDSKKPVV